MNSLTATTVPVSDQQLAARAAIYRAFSLLFAGPAMAGDDRWQSLPLLLQSGADKLPFDFAVEKLLQRLQQLDASQQARLLDDYSLFFESGSGGMQFPIREELALDTGSIKPKEELVRYYELFAYQLDSKMQWQPDHLAIALEFMAFLIEAQWHQSDQEQILSYMLGQRDFCQRHLLNWLPTLASALQTAQPEHFYCHCVIDCIDYLQKDNNWLIANLSVLEDV